MNKIYEDASENIHGTLFGATFHTGIMFGKRKEDQSRKYQIGLGFTLYMLLGLLIEGILYVVCTIIPADELLNKSCKYFRKTELEAIKR